MFSQSWSCLRHSGLGRSAVPRSACSLLADTHFYPWDIEQGWYSSALLCACEPKASVPCVGQLVKPMGRFAEAQIPSCVRAAV